MTVKPNIVQLIEAIGIYYNKVRRAIRQRNTPAELLGALNKAHEELRAEFKDLSPELEAMIDWEIDEPETELHVTRDFEG